MNPFEPTADARLGAKTLWDYYSALMQQGFTETQAMDLLHTILSSTLGK